VGAHLFFSLFACGGFENDGTETPVPYLWGRETCTD